MSSAKADLDALNLLATDARLAQATAHVPNLSFFELLGCTRDEIAHSRVIATLFDPHRHLHAYAALSVFVERLGRELDPSRPGLREDFLRVVSSTWTTVRVRREVSRIDIVIEIITPIGNVVIGIENKIDADEQPKQVARYQDSLDRAYPHHVAVMAFLTPSKRSPKTADATSRVPCVVLDYSTIIAAIHASLNQTAPGSTDARVLGELARHLQEEILEDKQIRKVVRELWKTHGRALELAMEHRPRIADVQEAYQRLLRVRLGKDVEFGKYPTQGELREIQLTLPSWEKADLPFTFMFYAGLGEPPKLRLLIYGESFQRRAQLLREWARSVNPIIGNSLDEEFRSVSKWTVWRRVFLEDDYPVGAVLDARAFDEETAIEAANRVFDIIDRLEPHIGQLAKIKTIRRNKK